MAKKVADQMSTSDDYIDISVVTVSMDRRLNDE